LSTVGVQVEVAGVVGVDGGAVGLVGGGVEKPVDREKLGVGLDFVGVGVFGTFAVFSPPVIICFVAIGRLGLLAR
jgi:hypothetical protein